MSNRYAVAIHGYGRKRITRDCPAQGLLEWPQSTWTNITQRPLGIKSAIALANAQSCHATVQVWGTAEKVHDNGKPPFLPSGWCPDNQARNGEDGGSWHPLKPYLDSLTARGTAINVAMYAGHGTIRDAVLGKDFKRVATPAEVEKMRVNN